MKGKCFLAFTYEGEEVFINLDNVNVLQVKTAERDKEISHDIRITFSNGLVTFRNVKGSCYTVFAEDIYFSDPDEG